MSFGFGLELAAVTIVWINGCDQQNYSIPIFKFWLATYGLSSLWQSLFSWILYTNVLQDIDSVLSSPIRNYSEKQEKKAVRLEARRKGVWLQRFYHCGLAPVNCVVLFTALFNDGFFAALIYVCLIDMMLFSLKTPYQLQHDLTSGSNTEKEKLALDQEAEMKSCIDCFNAVRKSCSSAFMY